MKRIYRLLTLFVLAPLVALPATDSSLGITKAAEKDESPPYFPAFSWDRVPIYQMFADSDHLLTDAEVAEIASTTDFLCIEKQHGYKMLGGAELGAKHEIARFKALQPGTKGLFYFNSAFAYSFVTCSQVFRFGQVSDKYKSFLILDPKTGELARRGTVYFFDVLNPGFRTWWADTVGRCVRESGADGLFVDQMHGFSWLRPERKNEVAKAQAELMRMAKEAIGPGKILLLNNAADIPDLFAIGDAFMFEHYDTNLLTKEALVKDWVLLQRISRAGKIAVWRIGVEVEERNPADAARKSRLTDAEYEALSKKRMPFYLAAFLVGAQPNSYFQYGWGWGLKAGPLARYPEFKKPLGKPLGDYTRPQPSAWVFQREFEHASVRLDLEAREGKIEWK